VQESYEIRDQSYTRTRAVLVELLVVHPVDGKIAVRAGTTYRRDPGTYSLDGLFGRRARVVTRVFDVAGRLAIARTAVEYLDPLSRDWVFCYRRLSSYQRVTHRYA